MSFEALAAADLAYALRTTGVLITLGAASAYGQVKHAPDEVLEEATGAVSSRTVRILIQTGTLAGLATRATLVIGSGSYVVHRHGPIEDEAMTEIIAVPA